MPEPIEKLGIGIRVNIWSKQLGLFSKLTGSAPSQAQATARAVLTPALLVAISDGSIDQSEVDQIINGCMYNPIFHALGAKQTANLWNSILAECQSKGAEAVFAKAQAAMTPKLVETAMCFAVRTALADGHADKRELDMLSALGQRLGLPLETFENILNVMIMMQRRAA